MDVGSWAGIAGDLSAVTAVFEALVLLVSGISKLLKRRPTRRVVQEFAGIPPQWSALAVDLVAGAELLAASALLVPAWRFAGGLLAAALYGSYLMLILRAIRRGRRDVDCGCSFGGSRRPLGAFHVARNAVLTGLAVFVALAAGAWPPVGFESAVLVQLPAGLAFLGLYGALDQVMALQPIRDGALL